MLSSRRPKTKLDADGVAQGIAGWDAVQVAIDDATRLAYVEVLLDEKATTAITLLRRTIAFYERHGTPSSA